MNWKKKDALKLEIAQIRLLSPVLELTVLGRKGTLTLSVDKS
jgi:hypothetical protein